MVPQAWRRGWLLAIAINLGAVLAGLFAFEVWRSLQPGPGEETRIEGTVKGFHEPAGDVGYIPRPNQRATHRMLFREHTVYDVVYTIGPDRFRVVPRPEAAGACVLLFGDSYTFGEGVNDNETYAWQLAERGGIAVHNFSLRGWGPHQMLAGLQSGRFRAATTCTPTHAVYLMIPEHVVRVAGRTSWDIHGPRYRPGPDGRPVREGNFDTHGDPEQRNAFDDGLLGWRRLLGMRRDRTKEVVWTAEEADLTATVIVEAAAEIARLYRGVRLQVLDYGDTPNRVASINARLAAAGIAVHALESINPDYRDNGERYRMKYDGHPTPAAYRVIADYIAREIVAKGP
jgi:hypothetical protein